MPTAAAPIVLVAAYATLVAQYYGLNRRTAVAAGGILARARRSLTWVERAMSRAPSATGQSGSPRTWRRLGSRGCGRRRARASASSSPEGWPHSPFGAPRAAPPADGIPRRARRLAARQRLPQRRDRRGGLPATWRSAPRRGSPDSRRTSESGRSGTASAKRPGRVALSRVIPPATRSTQIEPRAPPVARRTHRSCRVQSACPRSANGRAA